MGLLNQLGSEFVMWDGRLYRRVNRYESFVMLTGWVSHAFHADYMPRACWPLPGPNHTLPWTGYAS